MLKIRWFGSPWPSEMQRAPVCEDDACRLPIETVAGSKCMSCGKTITERDRGVVTACSPSIFGHWRLTVTDGGEEEAGIYPVCSYHLLCFLDEVVGGEVAGDVAARMHLRPNDVKPLQMNDEEAFEFYDVPEHREPAPGEPQRRQEDAEPGRGWHHES